MIDAVFLSNIAFWLLAGMMVIGALGVILHRSIVYNALFLLLTFLSIAGIFVLLNAPFLAAAQVLVYGVGLTIVLIFGIMLTGDTPVEDADAVARKNTLILPAIASIAIFATLVWGVLQPNFKTGTLDTLLAPTAQATASAVGARAIILDGGVNLIAQQIFNQYLIPFELASVLLLLAMVGAIILSQKHLPEEEGEAPLARELPTLGTHFGDDLSDSSSVSDIPTAGVH